MISSPFFYALTSLKKKQDLNDFDIWTVPACILKDTFWYRCTNIHVCKTTIELSYQFFQKRKLFI